MSIFSRILSWFRKPTKPEPKAAVELMLNEVATPGSRTQWGVDVLVNGKVRTTHWFTKKPTKKQLSKLLQDHQ